MNNAWRTDKGKISILFWTGYGSVGKEEFSIPPYILPSVLGGHGLRDRRGCQEKKGGEKTNITSIWVMKRHHLCQILTVEETTEAKGKLGNALGRPRSGLHSKRRIESGLEGWWGCLLELADPSRYIFQVETQTSNYRTFKISLNASSTMDSVLAASI